MDEIAGKKELKLVDAALAAADEGQEDHEDHKGLEDHEAMGRDGGQSYYSGGP